MTRDDRIQTASNDDEYLPAGEDQGVEQTFTADAIAGAFGAVIERVGTDVPAMPEEETEAPLPSGT